MNSIIASKFEELKDERESDQWEYKYTVRIYKKNTKKNKINKQRNERKNRNKEDLCVYMAPFQENPHQVG